VKRRRQIDRQDLVPFLGRELIERRDILNAGIVDQHIEPAMLGDRRRDHLRDRLGPGHVGIAIADLDAKFG